MLDLPLDFNPEQQALANRRRAGRKAAVELKDSTEGEWSQTITSGQVVDCIPTNWGETTDRIARGDRQAFEIYYRHYFEFMYAEARRVTRLDEASCLDIVQDAMLKVIHSIKRIDNEKSLSGWSRAVVRNTAFDRLRRLRRQSFAPQTITDPLPADLTATGSGETQAREFELRARELWLEQELLELPADIQRLFELRYRLGWTLKRIAQSLGFKTGAVDGKLRRAIEKLRAKAAQEQLGMEDD